MTKHHKQQGVELVELALILPLLIILSMLVVEFGRTAGADHLRPVEPIKTDPRTHGHGSAAEIDAPVGQPFIGVAGCGHDVPLDISRRGLGSEGRGGQQASRAQQEKLGFHDFDPGRRVGRSGAARSVSA